MAREQIRREVGWIVYGSVLAVLSGIITNLWTSYHIKVLESSGYTDWMQILILSSIVLVVLILFMSLWSIKQIRRGYQQR